MVFLINTVIQYNKFNSLSFFSYNIKEKQYEEQPSVADSNYYESTRVNVKPSLWQRFKQSKFVRTIKYIMKIRIVLDVPALPSADDERK